MQTMQSLKEELSEAQVGLVLENEPLANHTTWKIGGPADLYLAPKDRAAFIEAFKAVVESGVPWKVIGRGSNLLVRDGGIRGVVLSLAHLNRVCFSGNAVAAEGGHSFVRLAVLASQRGLSGLEFAGGIPGSVGGAVFMNAGAHGSEVSRILKTAEVLLEDGRLTNVNKEEMSYSYRTSVLHEQVKGVVMQAKFSLIPGDRDFIVQDMKQFRNKRLLTQPLSLPCAGSVFRNPPGGHAARLIEEAGLKGRRVGDAQVSTLHANFIVNLGQATAKDVLTLIELCRTTIDQKYGIRLQTEVQVTGEA